MKIICFLSLVFIHVVSFTFAQSEVAVEAEYSIDTNSVWDVSSIESRSFKPYRIGEEINIGYNKNTTVWCSFKLRNTNLIKGRDVWLSFDNNQIDSLVVYHGSKVIDILGDRTPCRSPFLTALALPIKLDPGQEEVFYVKIKKEISALSFTCQLTDGLSLARQSDLKIAIISFFLGIVFLLILFNVLLLLISKRRLFLFYILYSLLSVLYILISTNYAKHLLFADFFFYSEMRIYTSCLWVIGLCAFLSHYLGLARHEPVKYKIIVAANTMNMGLILVTIWLLAIGRLEATKLPMLIGYFNFLLALVLVGWSTVLHLKINRPAAIYVILSFLPQSIWGLVFILNVFGVLSSDIHVDWMVYICLYEVLLFGYVLTKNYIETFQKNNKLIKEITIEKERSLQAITQVQIRERRSIANIIHDNFGSKLAYILQLIQLKNIGLAEDHIKVLTNDIREISHQILPKSLDEGALVSSLKSQISSLNIGLSGAQIDLFTYDFPENLDEVWIYDLYLISLEIINNSLKHGNASSVVLELYGYPDAYVFQYTDEGIGFAVGCVAKGFGLENIEKRVKYYKGEFEISSRPGEGTVVQIVIPV